MKIVYLIFMSLSVFILTSVLLIRQNTQTVFGSQTDLYSINVVLDKALSPEESMAIVEKIKTLNPVQINKVTLISAKDQLLDVQAALPAYSRGFFEDEEIAQVLNPLIEVQLSPDADRMTMSYQIKSFPGVEQASAGNDWTEKIRSLFETFEIILNTIFILFFVILSFLITVLIRNYLVDSKELISLLALLGATPQQAFMSEYISIMGRTFLAYILGIVSALGLAYVIQHKLAANFYLAFINEKLSFLTITNILIILSGLVLNLAISYFLSYQYILKEYYHES